LGLLSRYCSATNYHPGPDLAYNLNELIKADSALQT